MVKKKTRKGSSRKLNKMSEEDRILVLEQQRLAEEEMRKKKENDLAKFLKHKLMQEEKATKFNLNKLNHQWRNIMREAKSKELKKDIEILSQTFERVVDRKESVIKALAKDLEEADEQYLLALRKHLSNVDNLMDLQYKRINKLREEFEDEQKTLMTEFDSERSLIDTEFNQQMRDLNDILFAMEMNFNEQEEFARNEFQSNMDEIKNRNIEETHALKAQLDSAGKNLLDQMHLAINNYKETTDERKKAFEELKRKDENSASEIDTQMRKIQRISDSIAQLKAKMAANAKESEEANRELKEEKEIMVRHFQILKGKMNEMRGNQHERLKDLTIQSQDAISKLKEQLAMGEKLLKQAEICRKLETEQEKVLPFYASSLNEEEKEDIEEAMKEELNNEFAEVFRLYLPLEGFWKRYNKSLLDKCALDREKADLSLENQQLRTLLKSYLDGISVNDEILSNVNPLFVVNHKSNVNMNVPVRDNRVARKPHQQQIIHSNMGGGAGGQIPN
ncbi:DgyrCDS10084 [Dimorphilus gyrociliatus]|uniref:Dynein regulatory complex subunit 2 n=1 Tax=Dimorphilus gyrociliatus TaxID=2664684 RepID=A0A7I8VZ26_9ANNE|nr:DgyrCDS10084 [Dimorphilus gyrociliatus]